MLGYIVFFIISMSLVTIVGSLQPSGSNSPIERRKRQTKNLFTENVLKEKLASTIEKRVKPSKKMKLEEDLQKAGLKLDYFDYIVVNIFSSLIFAAFFGIVMSNPILAVIFLILGYFVPGQVIQFIKNKRIATMEKQIGSFMQMVTKRYENTDEFHKAFAMTVTEFKGEEPIYTELQRTIIEMNLGIPTEKALTDFAKRSNNKFMLRYAAYYKLVSELGDKKLKKSLLEQAIKQYDENYQIKRSLKKEISGPVQEAYIMLGFVPAIALYQSVTNDSYIYFMTQTSMGRIGTAGIVGTLILITWFVNAKLGAPLD